MYKFGQGMVSRIGAFVVLLVVGFYAGFKWFHYADFLNWSRTAGVVGAFVFLGLFAWLGAWLAFYRARSGDFLIDMDGELRKVVWPALQPLFEPKTDAWGHTYVVIICTIIFTVIIWLIDMVLYYGVDRFLFNTLLFSAT